MKVNLNGNAANDDFFSLDLEVVERREDFVLVDVSLEFMKSYFKWNDLLFYKEKFDLLIDGIKSQITIDGISDSDGFFTIKSSEYKNWLSWSVEWYSVYPFHSDFAQKSELTGSSMKIQGLLTPKQK